MRPRSVLIFAPSEIGGIAEHAHYQALELARRGIAVTMLTRANPVKAPLSGTYRQMRVLPGARDAGRVRQVVAASWSNWTLAWWVLRLRPDLVLLEANTEYFAPLWAWPHLILSRLLRVPYLANFHDPLRARHFGPRWLHDWSVALSNAVVWGGLIHGTPPKDAVLPARLRLAQAPLGGFDETAAAPVTFDLRARLGIDPDSFVLLAFGHIADRKNLDLLIRALAMVQGVALVVAGRVGSSSQKPVSHYREVARAAGVAGRVHFRDEFVPDPDIPAYFLAADAVALTYAREFVSQSGVLQHAVAWAKPVLASGGPGPLRETVEAWELGVFVEPDDEAALVAGLERVLRKPASSAAFAAYRDAATWPANIDALLKLYASLTGSQTPSS